MKIRKIISLMLALVLLGSSVFFVSAEEETDTGFCVDATLYDYNTFRDGTVFTELYYTPGDVNFDNMITGKDVLYLKKYLAGGSTFSKAEIDSADYSGNGMITGEDLLYILKIVAGVSGYIPYLNPADSNYTVDSSYGTKITASSAGAAVHLDLSKYDYSDRDREFVLIDISGVNGDSFEVYACYNGRQVANLNDKCNLVGIGNGYIFDLPDAGPRSLTGLILSFTNKKTGAIISEIFLCDSLESAEWIAGNHIAEPTDNSTALSCSLEGEKTAIRLVGMTDDDRNNTNGGMYHDFVNTKWPSIAVDENDTLYVVGSGNRMIHVDPFGATIMTVSEDGGNTWSKPRNISNTVMDDRDAGILYLGNGEMLVSYFTSSGTSYLPGGSNYNALRPTSVGGSAPSWAAEWDSSNNPVGGIIGTYLDMLSYINDTDVSYDLSAASYVIKSKDYGASWNTEAYSFLGNGYTSGAAKMLSDYKITKPATQVPVTSAHGPMLRSDGKILFAGKVMTGGDAPIDSMAVYISDDGTSWEYLSQIPTPEGYYYNNFHELSVCENADGALVCAIRAQTCNDVEISPTATVYTCFSYDGGISWTVPAPTGIDGTPPHLLTLNNGDILMTYSDRTDPRSIRAKISTDGGRTWSEDAVISDNFFSGDDMGYPASAVLSDGTVVSVWYGTYKVSSANEQYSSIISKRWTYTVE